MGRSILLGVYLFAVLVSTHLHEHGIGVPYSGRIGHIHGQRYVGLNCPVGNQRNHLVMLHDSSSPVNLVGCIGVVPFCDVDTFVRVVCTSARVIHGVKR